MSELNPEIEKRKSCRKSFSIGCLCTTVAIIAIALLGYYGMWIQPFSNAKFDRAIWLKAKSDDFHNPRGPMTMDLRRNHLHHGMTRQQVRSLLGPPDCHVSHDPSMDSYWLGAWGGFQMDSQSLDIYYNPSGNMCSSYITDH
jgi:hypothetical protein